METKLIRLSREQNYTAGALCIDGNVFCHTLEPHCIDWKREAKTKGRTAIPEGRYELVEYTSRRFMRQMPLLKDVPHFDGVLIHAGNRVSDTEGCILVGRKDTPSTLTESRATFARLWQRLQMEWGKGERVFVTIV